MIPAKDTQSYKRFMNGSTGEFFPWFPPKWSPSSSHTEWFKKNKQYILAASVVVGIIVFCLCLGLSTTTKTPTGFIIAGGYRGSYLRSAEVFNPITGHSCPVGDLPGIRQDAPICNNIICGGYGQPEPDQSCVMFDGRSSFTRLPVSLIRRRDDHVCWGLKTGEVILFGSYDSMRTTERVSADGSSSRLDFNLPYDTSYSCGIDLGEYYVVTGGYSNIDTVALFSQTGFIKYLDNLKVGRRSHACSKFMDDSGQIALLVTGGYQSSGSYLSSTEIYSESTAKWSFAASLPSARSAISAANLDNSVFVFGGRTGSSAYSSEIVSYDHSSDSWKVVGEMVEQRSYYGVSQLAEVSEVCP